LTAASVPSGAKFNKLSQYIWGEVAPTGKIPRGVRWRMYHRDPSDTTPEYAVKDGGTPTILYQDNATTEFAPLTSLDSNNMGFANGRQGELVEVSAGGGNDTSVTPASFFQWDGSSDIIIEIATKQTASGYQTNSGAVFVKNRMFLTGRMRRSDSDASAYDFTATNTSTSLIPYLKNSSTNYTGWTNLSAYTINTGNIGSSDHELVQALKLDYTT